MNPGDIRDIRGPIAGAVHHAWWPYVAIVLGAIAVGFAVRAFIRRRRRPLSPEDEAIRVLETARELIEHGQPQIFGTRVSDAVRTYVEDAFAVRAPRRTTDELLADLMTDASPVAAHRDKLGAFLEFCDLAKYARWSLSADDMAGMLDSAEAFVRATAAAPIGGST